ncbi:hypothetical protein [Pseudomonas sp. TE24901]
MPLPSNVLGVTVKQLVVLVTVGCVAAYLFSNTDDNTPQKHALEAFIRSQEQVAEQVGTVLDIALVKEVVAHPGYGTTGNTPGYTRSMFAVEGEKGRVLVTLKQVEGEQGVEVTQISRQ